eukprot:1888502-Alexandrium_andersonii.AAC.1
MPFPARGGLPRVWGARAPQHPPGRSGCVPPRRPWRGTGEALARYWRATGELLASYWRATGP